MTMVAVSSMWSGMFSTESSERRSRKGWYPRAVSVLYQPSTMSLDKEVYRGGGEGEEAEWR